MEITARATDEGWGTLGGPGFDLTHGREWNNWETVGMRCNESFTDFLMGAEVQGHHSKTGVSDEIPATAIAVMLSTC